MGGGGGGYTSTASGKPWEDQAEYLRPLFETSFYGASGKKLNPDYNPKKPSAAPQFVNDIDSAYENWFFPDELGTQNQTIPGRLEYFGAGAPYENRWKEPTNIIDKYSRAELGSPTVAEFTTPQITAQQYTQNLADSRLGDTGIPLSTSLLGKSEAALGDVITGAKTIPQYNIATPTIRDPGDITGNTINYSPDMIGASLGFDYWNPLSDVAEGRGGNKYLDDMITAATRGINRNYLNNVIPNINSAAEDAGARGSGAWEDLRTNANKDYLEAIGDVEANIRGNAFNNQLNAKMQALGLGGELAGKQSGYTQEANRINTQLGLEKAMTEAGYGQEANVKNVMNDLQRYFEEAGIATDINKQNALLKTQTDTQNIDNILKSLGFAPELNQATYSDIAALSASGAEQQQMNQDILNSYIQQWEQGQLEGWNRAALLSQLVGGNFGGTVTQTAQKKGK